MPRRIDPAYLVLAVLVIPFVAGTVVSGLAATEAPVGAGARMVPQRAAQPTDPPAAIVDLQLEERTRGQEITIAGRAIQLPPDAYVGRFIPDVLCLGIFVCAEPPLLEIRRGEAAVLISAVTGQLAQPPLAPEEREVFAFLLDAVPSTPNVSTAGDFDFVGAGQRSR